ncbi:MAG: hypothetical protein ACI8ZB_003181 [Desulforhopalus sp.]
MPYSRKLIKKARNLETLFEINNLKLPPWHLSWLLSHSPGLVPYYRKPILNNKIDRDSFENKNLTSQPWHLSWLISLLPGLGP